VTNNLLGCRRRVTSFQLSALCGVYFWFYLLVQQMIGVMTLLVQAKKRRNKTHHLKANARGTMQFIIIIAGPSLGLSALRLSGSK